MFVFCEPVSVFINKFICIIFFLILHMSNTIYLSSSDIFHLVWSPWDSSMLLQMALFQGISESSDTSSKWSSFFRFPLCGEMWSLTKRIFKVSQEFEESGPETCVPHSTLILDHTHEGCLTTTMGYGTRARLMFYCQLEGPVSIKDCLVSIRLKAPMP